MKKIAYPSPIYYIVNRLVFKLNSSTTKVRPVCDVSARTPKRIFLNNGIVTGPSLYLDLMEILIIFRCWPYVVTAVMAKAILQISVHSKDKDVRRFLLLCVNGVRHVRFTRVIFGNTSGPFFFFFIH